MQGRASVSGVSAGHLSIYFYTRTTGCKTGWVNLESVGKPEVCFYFVPSKASWKDMKSLCEAMSSTLAKFEGEHHMNAVQYINSQPGEQEPGTGGKHQA